MRGVVSPLNLVQSSQVRTKGPWGPLIVRMIFLIAGNGSKLDTQLTRWWILTTKHHFRISVVPFRANVDHFWLPSSTSMELPCRPEEIARWFGWYSDSSALIIGFLGTPVMGCAVKGAGKPWFFLQNTRSPWFSASYLCNLKRNKNEPTKIEPRMKQQPQNIQKKALLFVNAARVFKKRDLPFNNPAPEGFRLGPPIFRSFGDGSKIDALIIQATSNQ